MQSINSLYFQVPVIFMIHLITTYCFHHEHLQIWILKHQYLTKFIFLFTSFFTPNSPDVLSYQVLKSLNTHPHIFLVYYNTLPYLLHSVLLKTKKEQLFLGTFLSVQWWRLCASTAWGVGGAEIFSLIVELRYHRLHSAAKKKKIWTFWP